MAVSLPSKTENLYMLDEHKLVTRLDKQSCIFLNSYFLIVNFLIQKENFIAYSIRQPLFGTRGFQTLFS